MCQQPTLKLRWEYCGELVLKERIAVHIMEIGCQQLGGIAAEPRWTLMCVLIMF